MAREKCRPRIISPGSAELKTCRVDRESVKMPIFPVCFPLSNSCANGECLSSMVGALKATRNREGSGVTIWVSDVDSTAAIFHSCLSRPVGVDMSPDIVSESVSNRGKGGVSELSCELFLWG